MPVFTSTSDHRPKTGRTLFVALALLLGFCSNLNPVWGQEKDPTQVPEEEDFKDTPYTRYGEFNEEEDEIESQLFFQYGRFFGFSAGAGIHGVTGNRGLLYSGGFPMIELKIHYWFNFTMAMDLKFYTVGHSYQQLDSGGAVTETFNANILTFAFDLKYYFPTQDASAAISFANPYLLLGGGSFTKTVTDVGTETPDRESTFGLSVGAGLEFPISTRSTYFYLEAAFHFVSFIDDSTGDFADQGVADLSGNFYTISTGVLFTY